MKNILKSLTKLSFVALCAMPQAVAAQGAAFMKVVAADGTGDYLTVQEAVNSCPADGTRTLIFVRNGLYEGNVVVPKGVVVSLIGESRDGTVLSHDKSHTMPGYEDASTTSTIYIESADFYGENFTTQNTVGPSGGQAECFTNAGDRATLRNVALKANQDGVRFFTDSRSYLKDCYIEGTVDYIYDSGIAFIDDCTIKQLRGGYIVAPGNCYAVVPRGESSKLTGQTRIWGLGLFLRGCKLIYDADKVNENDSWLGRPWGKQNCAAYFINCYMDRHIKPAGWQTMSEGTKPYLGEFGSMDMDGNKLDVSERVSWAMTEDPDHMSPSQYIDQKVVDNLFNMEYVFKTAEEQGNNVSGSYDPLPLVEPAALPLTFKADGGSLTWDAVSGVAGYLIYKNGAYIANVAGTSYTDAAAAAADEYTIRTVSANGCLSSEMSSSTSGIGGSIKADGIDLHTTRYGAYWNRTARASLYSLDGGMLLEREGMSLEWDGMPGGCYILRLQMDGETVVRKIVINS